MLGREATSPGKPRTDPGRAHNGDSSIWWRTPRQAGDGDKGQTPEQRRAEGGGVTEKERTLGRQMALMAWTLSRRKSSIVWEQR